MTAISMEVTPTSTLFSTLSSQDRESTIQRLNALWERICSQFDQEYLTTNCNQCLLPSWKSSMAAILTQATESIRKDPHPPQINEVEIEQYAATRFFLYSLLFALNSFTQHPDNSYHFNFTLNFYGVGQLHIYERTRAHAYHIKVCLDNGFVLCPEEGEQTVISESNDLIQNAKNLLSYIDAFMQKAPRDADSPYQFLIKPPIFNQNLDACLSGLTLGVWVQDSLGLSDTFISIEELMQKEGASNSIDLNLFCHMMRTEELQYVKAFKESTAEELQHLPGRIQSSIIEANSSNVGDKVLSAFCSQAEVHLQEAVEAFDAINSYNAASSFFLVEVEEKILFVFQLYLMLELMNFWVESIDMPLNAHLQLNDKGFWDVSIWHQEKLVRYVAFKLDGIALVALELNPLTSEVEAQPLVSDDHNLSPYEHCVAIGDYIHNLLAQETKAHLHLIKDANNTRVAVVAKKIDALRAAAMCTTTDIADQTISIFAKANLSVLTTTVSESSNLSAFNFLDSVTLTNEGINLCIAHLNEKHEGRINCIVTSDLEQVAAILSALRTSSFNGKIAFIMRLSPSEFGTHHTFAILVEKAEETIKIAIMDPLGELSGYIFEASLMRLKKAIPPGAKTYIASCKRQNANENCVSFALYDVELFFIEERSFFEEIEESGELVVDKEWSSRFFIKRLPPAYMAPTQSFSILDSYIDSYSDMPEMTLGLEEAIEEHTRLQVTTARAIDAVIKDRHLVVKTKKMNMMMEHARLYHYTNLTQDLAIFPPDHLIPFLKDRDISLIISCLQS